MALLVERALLQERHALVEAGTGTGKSFAYLVPLALSLGGGRAVVSTGTIALQEQLIHKDIPFLEQALDVNLRAMLAKGKGNYLCLLRLREEMESPSLFEADISNRLLAWAEHTATGDRAELDFNPGELWSRVSPDDGCPGRKCFFYRDCFFVRARANLQDAGLIVCNHALFFNDLNVRAASGGRAFLLPGYQAVVLDEAHHVEDVARQSMSTKVSSMRLPVLLFQMRRLAGCNLDAVNSALGLNNEFFAAVVEYGPGGRAPGSNDSGDLGRFLLPDSDRLRSLGRDLLQMVELVKTSFAPGPDRGAGGSPAGLSRPIQQRSTRDSGRQRRQQGILGGAGPERPALAGDTACHLSGRIRATSPSPCLRTRMSPAWS